MPAINKVFRNDCSKILGDKGKFPDNYVNLIVTSPPYADKRAFSYGGVSSKKCVEWFMPISTQLKRILKVNGSFIL